jgi:hypothetical protein
LSSGILKLGGVDIVNDFTDTITGVVAVADDIATIADLFYSSINTLPIPTIDEL